MLTLALALSNHDAAIMQGPQLDLGSLTIALDVVQAWAVLITVGFTIVLLFFLAFCICSKKDDGYEECDLSHGITAVHMVPDTESGGGTLPRINGTTKTGDQISETSSRCTLKRELPAIPCNVIDQPIGGSLSSDLYAVVGEAEPAPSGVKIVGGVQVLPSVGSPVGASTRISSSATVVTRDVMVFSSVGEKTRCEVVRAETQWKGVDPQKWKGTDSQWKSSEPHWKSSEPQWKSTEPQWKSTEPPTWKGSEIGHTYALGAKNHQYAQVKKPEVEHPYAHIGAKALEKPEVKVEVKGKVAAGTARETCDPAPPVPEKRMDLEEQSAITALPQPAPDPKPPTIEPSPIDISAAQAITGRMSANPECPYMTPPDYRGTGTFPVQPHPPNLSGDSQDSRGYTSISVREPLAALKAAQAKAQARAGVARADQLIPTMDGEGYYMTVSDDSADETYACIYEGGASVAGSETYAQIEPRPSPEEGSNVPPIVSPPETGTQGESEPPPAPPSVDSLRHVVHSRQASSSSAASTIGSPGTEKRTRSPLPPLPQGDPGLYSAGGVTTPDSPPSATSEKSPQRTVEDMYAKVIKNRSKDHRRGDSDSDSMSASSHRGSGDRWSASGPLAPPVDAMSKSMVVTGTNTEGVGGGFFPPVPRARSSEDWSSQGATAALSSNRTSAADSIFEETNYEANYESIAAPTEANYETISQPLSSFPSLGVSEPGYETVKGSEPGYETVKGSEPGYETVKGVEPGYETVKGHGYETVKGSEPSYEMVKSDPPYATVEKSEDNDPGYETVRSSRNTEPGYESVNPLVDDPGYETVHHDRDNSELDPMYEQLKFGNSERHLSEGDNEPGYEAVRSTTLKESLHILDKQSGTRKGEDVVPPPVVSNLGSDSIEGEKYIHEKSTEEPMIPPPYVDSFSVSDAPSSIHVESHFISQINIESVSQVSMVEATFMTASVAAEQPLLDFASQPEVPVNSQPLSGDLLDLLGSSDMPEHVESFSTYEDNFDMSNLPQPHIDYTVTPLMLEQHMFSMPEPLIDNSALPAPLGDFTAELNQLMDFAQHDTSPIAQTLLPEPVDLFPNPPAPMIDIPPPMDPQSVDGSISSGYDANGVDVIANPMAHLDDIPPIVTTTVDDVAAPLTPPGTVAVGVPLITMRSASTTSNGSSEGSTVSVSEQDATSAKGSNPDPEQVADV